MQRSSKRGQIDGYGHTKVRVREPVDVNDGVKAMECTNDRWRWGWMRVDEGWHGNHDKIESGRHKRAMGQVLG